jgi:hypothetical protein
MCERVIVNRKSQNVLALCGNVSEPHRTVAKIVLDKAMVGCYMSSHFVPNRFGTVVTWGSVRKRLTTYASRIMSILLAKQLSFVVKNIVSLPFGV